MYRWNEKVKLHIDYPTTHLFKYEKKEQGEQHKIPIAYWLAVKWHRAGNAHNTIVVQDEHIQTNSSLRSTQDYTIVILDQQKTIQL